MRIVVALLFGFGAGFGALYATFTPGIFANTMMTSGPNRMSIRLAEGTRVDLEPESKVEIVQSTAQLVRLKLHFGRGTFEVNRVIGRQLSLVNDSTEINVSDARFIVESGTRASVWVERGIVEVREATNAVRLSAGDAWPSVVLRASER